MISSSSAPVRGEGEAEGSVLWRRRVAYAMSRTAVFEWSGAVFSPLLFAVAVRIVLAAGASCVKLVNLINRESLGRR